MSKGRLTRQELSWLLTQEAQNAAERLRVGVQVLRTQAPPAPDVVINQDPTDPGRHVESSLDALDDVMKMLSNLNQRQSSSQLAVAPRRGRIDLAALIVEVAPEARVSIEPGSGTEVYGDEADFRRMLQVLVGHGGAGARGPPSPCAATATTCASRRRSAPTLRPPPSTERAWLSRMAVRYGGRHELEGGNETLVLPAEMSRAIERSARPFARSSTRHASRARSTRASSPPCSIAAKRSRRSPRFRLRLAVRVADRFATITKVCAGVASELRATLGPLTTELGSLRRHEVTDEQLDTLRRRLSAHAGARREPAQHRRAAAPHELETEVDSSRSPRAHHVTAMSSASATT